MRILVDASIIIDYLRTQNTEKSVYTRIITNDNLIMSLVTLAELYSGKSVQKEGKPKRILDEVVKGIKIIIPTIESVKEVGFLRAKYNLSLGDAFIAALALKHNLPLATLDVRDFGRIKGLKLLNK